MQDVQTETMSYRPYWIAWFVLLVLTIVMVFAGNRAVLIAGITAKATIIAFWFMHLRHERHAFVLYILGGIFLTGLTLFLLMVPDGRAM